MLLPSNLSILMSHANRTTFSEPEAVEAPAEVVAAPMEAEDRGRPRQRSPTHQRRSTSNDSTEGHRGSPISWHDEFPRSPASAQPPPPSPPQDDEKPQERVRTLADYPALIPISTGVVIDLTKVGSTAEFPPLSTNAGAANSGKRSKGKGQ